MKGKSNMGAQFKKRWLLISTVVVLAIALGGGYYLLKLKKGPYSASKFISFSYKWGVGDTLINSYHSASGHYQYLNTKDSLVKTKVMLRSNNIIFLHSKANELDFWNLPQVMVNAPSDLKCKEILRYEMTFNYEDKSKKITYYTNYTNNMAFATAAQALQKIIAQTLSEAEERYIKK